MTIHNNSLMELSKFVLDQVSGGESQEVLEPEESNQQEKEDAIIDTLMGSYCLLLLA